MVSNGGGNALPPQKPLKEKDFIHEGFLKNPFPASLSFLFVLAVTAIFWVGTSWYQSFMGQHFDESPFLRVTNRDFSTFLWQFPEHMRANVKVKAGYLTGFQYEHKVTPLIEEVDGYVVAPPELLFLYHTWDRLLRPEFSPGKISGTDFMEFLNYCEEWKPINWKGAPKGYSETVDRLFKGNAGEAAKDLALLSPEEMPLEVRMAFQGWHNYFKDYEAINSLQPTYSQLHKFFATHPHYERSYWRNIVMPYNPHYLESYNQTKINSDEKIPERELAPFLRVGLYNSEQIK